jgi:uncharacterized protein involved in response to NO
MPLLQLQEPPAVVADRLALFDLGFRPFYFVASVFSALSIPLWALQFTGRLPHPYLSGPVWHAHEMVFGFALAVIVGFLFTAGRNWSNLPTPTGAPLAALVALWIAGRVLVLTPFALAAAIANVAFPLAAAAALAVPFAKSGNRRNDFFIVLLAGLALAGAGVHLSQMGVVQLPRAIGIAGALDVVLFILAVMGGRVIPMFTHNGVPGSTARRQPLIEKLSLGSVLLLLAADLAGVTGVPLAGLALVAGGAHLARWLLWKPWSTWRVPLVWVLHLGYAWVPLHLVLRALAEWQIVPSSAATHALTVGAIGGLVIGMMTRTARGHTARTLRADRFDTTAYVLVAIAAAVRVLLPLASPGHTLTAVMISAALWSAGFGVYAVRYWPVLSRPRLDGRPG